MQDQAKRALERKMMEEQFKQGFRSVYRGINKSCRPGAKVHFVGDTRGYVVQKDGSIKRQFPKVKGKKARKADKRERRNRSMGSSGNGNSPLS